MALGNFFKKIGQAVVSVAKKASSSLVNSVKPMARLFRSGLEFLVGRKLDAEAADRVRDTLIQADVSPRMADDLVEKLQAAYKEKEIKSTDEVMTFLKDHIKKDFPPQKSAPVFAPPGETTVILIVGVNGSGKTTSIAKLAHRFKTEGKSVLLAPADTFRAAAVQQLITWAERIGVDYIPSNQGQEASSVAYQAIEKAIARKMDVVIVDTAGRLDNKKNLMDELEKMTRVIKKKLPGAPHEVLLVLDGNTGQTAVRQAKNFERTAGVTGLIITKLDGTAKGGAVISMRAEVDLPVKWIGLGEKMTDIEPFDADVFVDEIFKTEETSAES
ncbi:MAG TPA: signal recognition particle-docking protein FtsY [Planctomycetota bacterium]|nr:signal recognition particle-docking protein FtsY [Planctomycetota bacterium]